MGGVEPRPYGDVYKRQHKIMVPFTFKGAYTIKSLTEAGQYTINEVIAVLTDEAGKEVEVTMIQRWPVKRAITCYKEKPRQMCIRDRCRSNEKRCVKMYLSPLLQGGAKEQVLSIRYSLSHSFLFSATGR